MLFNGINLIEGSELQNTVVNSGTSFPALPSQGELFYRTDGTFQAMYFFDGEKWIHIEDDNSNKINYTPVNKAGDTMLGPLILSSTPSTALQAATKGYVDSFAPDFSVIKNKPTTYEGYGISDVQPLDNDLTALANLSTAGLLIRTGSGAAATRTITGTPGNIILTNGDGVSGNPTINLASGIVTPGSYSYVTVDTYGRVSAASTDSTSTSVSISGAAATPRSLYFKTGTNSRWAFITDSVSESGADAGSNFTINRISDTGTASAILTIQRNTGVLDFKVNPTINGVTVATTSSGVASAGKWTTARTISLTGDATVSMSVDGSANVTAALVLATVNSNVGTFGSSTTIPVITVSEKGLVTGVTSQTLSTTNIVEGTNLYFTNTRAAAAAPVQTVAGKNGAVSLVVADVSGAAPLTSPDLSGIPTAPTPTPGDNSTQIATTAFVQSTVTGGSVASAAKWTTARSLSLTGDASATLTIDGSTNASSTITLSTVNANAGSFGSTSSVSTFTVNDKGLITAAGSASIAITTSQVTSGTFADARIAQSNITQYQSALTIAESQITDGAILARVAGNESITGTWSFSNAVSGVDPTDGNQFATKQYVDNITTGLDPKGSVRAATAGSNIALAGTQTVDGVALIAGDRILVKDQTTASQNGIYVVNVDTWTRSADADNSPDTEVTVGMYCFVEEGTVNADSGWVLTTNGAITLDTTPLTFAQFTGLAQITAGNGLTKSGSTISVQTASSARIAVSASGVDLALVTDTGTGSFKKLTTDSYGRVTGTQAVATSDLTALLSSVYQPLSSDLSSIAGQAGTSGLLKKTGPGAWALDTSSYLTANQTISVSGDALGSGSTSISLTLATVNSNVGTFGSATALPVITVNAKGLITAVSAQTLSTTNVVEGTNLYFTNARAQSAINVSGTGLTYVSGVVTSNATASSTPSTIVARDGSGNTSVGVLTATSASLNNGTAVLSTATTTVPTTAATVVDTFPSATYRSVKYQVQIADGASYEMLEIAVIHDNTSVFMSTFGNVFTGAASLGTFDASLATGTVTVTFTAAAATSKTVRMVRVAVAI